MLTAHIYDRHIHMHSFHYSKAIFSKPDCRDLKTMESHCKTYVHHYVVAHKSIFSDNLVKFCQRQIQKEDKSKSFVERLKSVFTKETSEIKDESEMGEFRVSVKVVQTDEE